MLLLPVISSGIQAASIRSGTALIPTADPRVFLTPEPFLHIAGQVSIEVFHNGRLLEQMPAVPSASGEYFVAESVPGAGYNQVRLTSFTPSAMSRLLANYVIE